MEREIHENFMETSGKWILIEMEELEEEKSKVRQNTQLTAQIEVEIKNK